MGVERLQVCDEVGVEPRVKLQEDEHEHEHQQELVCLALANHPLLHRLLQRNRALTPRDSLREGLEHAFAEDIFDFDQIRLVEAQGVGNEVVGGDRHT